MSPPPALFCPLPSYGPWRYCLRHKQRGEIVSYGPTSLSHDGRGRSPGHALDESGVRAGRRNNTGPPAAAADRTGTAAARRPRTGSRTTRCRSCGGPGRRTGTSGRRTPRWIHTVHARAPSQDVLSAARRSTKPTARRVTRPIFAVATRARTCCAQARCTTIRTASSSPPRSSSTRRPSTSSWTTVGDGGIPSQRPGHDGRSGQPPGTQSHRRRAECARRRRRAAPNFDTLARSAIRSAAI